MPRRRSLSSGFGTLDLNGRFGNDSFIVSPVGLTGLTTIKVIGNGSSTDGLTVYGSTAADTVAYNPAGGPANVAITALRW